MLKLTFRVVAVIWITALCACDGCAIFRPLDADFDAADSAVGDGGPIDLGSLSDDGVFRDMAPTSDVGGEDVASSDLGAADLSTDMAAEDLGTDMAQTSIELPGCDVAPSTPAPATFVGDGTPASCTEAALKSSLIGGGVIGFDCGDAPHTMAITGEIAITQNTTLVGAGRIVLDAGDSSSIFRIDTTASATAPHLQLFGMELTGGYKRVTDMSDDCGAAVYRNGGTLTVVDSHLHRNRCVTGPSAIPFGGAIAAIRGGGLFVYDSLIEDNESHGGGGIYASNTPVSIVRTTIRNNRSLALSAGGLGVFEQGPLEICGSTISDNSAPRWGGGLFYDDDNPPASSVTISQSAFVRNVSGEDGGAADIEDTTLVIEYTSFVDNSALTGGALWLSGDVGLQIANSTFLRNVAGGSGGAMYSESSSGDVKNVTFFANRAAVEGAASANFLGGAPLSFTNTIFANNAGANTCTGTQIAGQWNLQYPDEPSLCTVGATTLDPMLEPPVALDRGEVVFPHATSPAVGNGMDCPPRDQRGASRPMACTLGSLEPLP